MKNKKPVIGITSSTIEYSGQESVMIESSYSDSIIKAGGIPIILPIADEEMAKQWVGLCDGIVLTGGEDMDPHSYNEEPHPKLNKIKPERDKFEISIVQNAKLKRLPILAICRGIQVINVALGGTIIQDIESTVPNCIQHTQKASNGTPTHSITIEQESFLYSFLGLREVRINSYHHQALGKIAPTLKVTARARDGIIEAVEGINKEDSMIIGVQWHPEAMMNDHQMNRLFIEFIKVCQSSQQQ